MFHLIGMGLAKFLSNKSAKHRSSKAMQVVTILKGRLAEMRNMTILRRAEPVRFSASTMAPGGVVETPAANNLSNNPTTISIDGVVGQFLNTTISTTVLLCRTLTDVTDARHGDTASLMQHVSIHNRFT